MSAASFALGSGELVPAVSVDQMRDIDRAMVKDFHIELAQMMENAGRNLADLARSLFQPWTATVLAGPGGNGGGGLVAARHLHNRGVRVSVVLETDRLAPVSAHQLDIVERMGIEVLQWPAPSALVIDALIGYGLHGDPAQQSAELINWANESSAPVLALDCPSGLDPTTGRPAVPCVQASATMTLALPKSGLASSDVVGHLYLADISVPPEVFAQMGLTVPKLFTEGPVVELHANLEMP